MKIAIENHKYAPELNKVYLNHSGKWYKYTAQETAGIKSIRQAREQLFKPVKPGKIATVTIEYSGHLAWKATQYIGRFKTYSELRRFINNRKVYHTLHERVQVKIDLIG